MWHVDQAGDDTVTVRRRISFITSLAYFYEVCPALLRITWFMLQKLPRRMVFGFLGFFDLWICAPDPATRRNACVCVFQILNFRVFVNEFCRTVFMQIRNFPRRILWLGFLHFCGSHGLCSRNCHVGWYSDSSDFSIFGFVHLILPRVGMLAFAYFRFWTFAYSLMSFVGRYLCK